MTLVVDDIQTFYRNSQALFGLSLKIPAGKAVTLLGRNGMGKTTAVNTIVGHLHPARGAIYFYDEKISGMPAHKIAQRGIGVVPEGRQVFPNLSVRENLIATADTTHARAWTPDTVLDLFPQLRARLHTMGAQLSGGEQQMLATGRALMRNPRLLILDEATEGLAPLVQADLWRKLSEIKKTGIALLVIDNNLDALCDLADQHYIVEKGAAVWHGDSEALRADDGLQARYFGV